MEVQLPQCSKHKSVYVMDKCKKQSAVTVMVTCLHSHQTLLVVPLLYADMDANLFELTCIACQ